MDATDKRILMIMQRNSKQTIKVMAAELGMTTTPVFERIKKLEKEGYIQRYSAVIDREKVGLSVLAYCSVSLDVHRKEYLEQFENDIRLLPEVIDCYHLAGMFDYLLKVVVADMEVYQHFIANKLASLQNIGRVQSFFVMKEIKHAGSYVIP